MSDKDAAFSAAQFSNQFAPEILSLNDTVTRIRMVSFKLSSNQKLIDTNYSKISMGGIAEDNRFMVGALNEQIESLSWHCWGQISDSCSPATQLDANAWQSIGQTPPGWLRTIFESALLMSSMPDQLTLDDLAKQGSVVVLRDRTVAQSEVLLPQAAAVLPAGFSVEDARIWWPWVMGGESPAIVVPTEVPHVLQEYSVAGLRLDAHST